VKKSHTFRSKKWNRTLGIIAQQMMLSEVMKSLYRLCFYQSVGLGRCTAQPTSTAPNSIQPAIVDHEFWNLGQTLVVAQ